MLRHHGGSRVGKGTYWDITNGERVDISSEGVLPGDAGKTYYRMSAAAVIVAGPVLGLLYAAFLPFIGIAMALKVVGQKIGGGVMELARGGASFAWRPSESYLTGKKGKEAKKEDAARESEEKKED